MTDLLRAALGHAADGFRVFPVKPKGKTPIVKDNLTVATTDEDQIREWWETYPDANVGLVAGDGLAVLDVDPDKGGNESLKALIEEHGQFRTKLVRTGGGGLHAYFKDDPEAPLAQSAGVVAPGLDIRAGGKGYVVGAGSVHPNGNLYEPINGAAPGPVPAWLRTLASSRREAPKRKTGEPIAEGERNAALASLAGTLRDKGLQTEAILAALHVENQARCSPPLTDGEVEKIAHSIGRYPPTRPYTEDKAAEDEFEAEADAPPPEKTGRAFDVGDLSDITDEKIVRAVLPRLRNRLRYAPGTGSNGTWYVWSGHKWGLDHALQHEMVVRAELTRLSQHLKDLAGAMATKKEAQPVLSAARRYQSSNGIHAVVKLLRAHVACSPADFDLDPYVLNTPEGVIDLRTGARKKGGPGQMLARSTVPAPAEGKAPLWGRFLKDISDGDPDLESYLQRVCGYALTGDVSEKSLWFIWGADADTGKSTFIRVLQGVLGDYADSVDVSAFISGFKGDRIPADLARLPGARLVTATEPAAGHSWDERRIKAITGGDEVSARFLYGQWFTFNPQFKIVIVGNHEPEIRTVDDAMLRRIHIVPFDKKIPRDKQVENLSRILVEREGPQILQWMIEGCLAWRDEGLAPPEVVLRTTHDYRDEEDVLQQWIDEECVLQDGVEESRRNLYRAWSIWCRGRGEEPGGMKAFKRIMDPKRRSLGLKESQVGDRRLRGYEGIGLRANVEMMGEEFDG